MKLLLLAAAVVHTVKPHVEHVPMELYVNVIQFPLVELPMNEVLPPQDEFKVKSERSVDDTVQDDKDAIFPVTVHVPFELKVAV